MTHRAFASYLGRAPCLGKSAGKNVRHRKRRGNTCRAGQVLRMAAATLWRSDTGLGAFFRAVARRKDKRAAVKATVRRISVLIYRGLKFGAVHMDAGVAAYERRMRERTVKTVRNLINLHGINELELKTAFMTPRLL